MKSLQLLFTSLLYLSLFIFVACPPDDQKKELTAQQEQAKKLKGTWTNASGVVVPSGVDNSVLDDLSMTFNTDNEFNPTLFSATGAPDFFSTQSSSSWLFSGSGTTVINLNGVAVIDQIIITSLSETELSISFSYAIIRTEGLSGTYSLTLSK